MKTLVLIRHLKSERPSPLPDFKRPLNERGRADAPVLGDALPGRIPRPDLILCSPAVRARQTWDLIADAAGWEDVPVRYEDGIYDNFRTALTDLIRNTRDEADVLCLVGHNPAISDAASWLCGEDSWDLPTGAVVHIGPAESDWGELRAGCGHLEDIIRPKDLQGA